ncbi:MAG: hypothetical protein APF84_18595 [Gracilibacter sp. BRH_c7a]|nr:MAG: hypothetical protein APF84_18595 [Gracilibacter sp. BRH_c7a]
MLLKLSISGANKVINRRRIIKAESWSIEIKLDKVLGFSALKKGMYTLDKKIIVAIKKKNRILIEVYNIIIRFVRDRHLLYITALKIKAKMNPPNELYQYSIMGVKEYCHKSQLPIRVLEKEKERLIYTPEYFGIKKAAEIQTRMSPEIYLVEMSDVDIIGSNSFLIKDKYCLYDMFSIDYYNRYDLRFASLKSIYKNKDVAIMAKDAKQEIKEAIFLLGFASCNYYHLTVELLAKLEYIDKNHDLCHLPIVVDEIIVKTPQLKQLLQVMNVKNHPIIPIKNEYKYRVKKLIYLSDCSWMPVNIKDNTSLINEDFRVSERSLKYIRDTVIAQLQIGKTDARRNIFISRKSTKNQRLINEKEVADLFCQYGFEVICPEELSFKEQVKAFSEASYVAGTSGAALTNIIYCHPEATFICIIPKEYNFNMYATIGKTMDLQSIFLDAHVVNKGEKFYANQFELEINYLREFLDKLKI